MHTFNLRHLFHLLRFQIILTGLAALFPLCSQAQFQNMADHDDKPYYFGITLGYNNANFKLFHSPKFLQSDSVAVVEPYGGKGFNMGLLGNLRLNRRFDLRFNPNLIFAEKNLKYVLKPDSSTQIKYIESVLLSFPLQVKFKSDRIGNFRVYTLAGLKMDYDLSANSHSRQQDDLVKLKRTDFGYEAGFGFEFYFPNFIFSPEIKLSNGFGNIYIPNKSNAYSNVIGKLISRMIVISIHLEG